MYSSARFSHLHLPPNRAQRGFTIIELLMVVAVILILVGITFGITRGVNDMQARAKTKAELASIAQGLELFKAAYGDYPWIADTSSNKTRANDLLKALTGWSILERDVSSNQVRMRDVQGTAKKSFIDDSKLSLSGSYKAGSPPSVDVYLLDSWGNQYVYAYKTSPTGWDKFGYILFSKGSDSKSGTLPSDGVINQTWREAPNNIDNIYVGE